MGGKVLGVFSLLGMPCSFLFLSSVSPPTHLTPFPFLIFSPHCFFLLFLIPPATCLPGLPFMSVPGTSLVGVLIFALVRYFCLPMFSVCSACLLPQSVLPVSPSLVCPCLLVAVGSVSVFLGFFPSSSLCPTFSSLLSLPPSSSISASLPAYHCLPILSLCLLSASFLSPCLCHSELLYPGLCFSFHLSPYSCPCVSPTISL